MHHRTIRGKILYTSKKPDRLGQERGRESFIITVHTDGKRTLRAHCEIDDPPTVLRDVVLSLDADNYPLDCFVRLTIDDRFEGSGWMRFSETHAETESFNVNDGRISQRLDLEQRTRWLASHPIGDETITVPAGTFDAHHLRYVDTAGQLPEEHPVYDVWCSADGDFIFLRGEVGGYMQTFYELIELET